MQLELNIDELKALIEFNKGIFNDTQNRISELQDLSMLTSMRIKMYEDLKYEKERLLSANDDLKDELEIMFEYAYSSQWTLVKKARFILTNTIKKIATTREIAEAIKEREELANYPITGMFVKTGTTDNSSMYIGAGEMSYSSGIDSEYSLVRSQIDPMPIVEINLTELISKLSATLKQKVDKKEIFGRVETSGIIYYGLIDWFDGKKAKEQYMK